MGLMEKDYDARQFQRECRDNFPFCEITEALRLGESNSYLRRVEDFEISSQSSHPELKGHITYAEFENFAREHYKKLGFEKIDEKTDLNGMVKIKFRKGGTELLLSMTHLEKEEKIGIFAFEYKPDEPEVDEAGSQPYPVTPVEQTFKM